MQVRLELHFFFFLFFLQSIVIDQPTFYEPRNVFDEHWDMRLDIDSMSYEVSIAIFLPVVSLVNLYHS